MARTDIFALDQSDLNGFLFADIGFEGNGMQLSVISLLARFGLDPWQEAARMAWLPRAAATDGLARLIAAMPSSLWPMSDATPIAARLVALLPRRTNRRVEVKITTEFDWRLLFLVILAGALLIESAFRLADGPSADRAAPAPIAAPIQPVQPPVGD